MPGAIAMVTQATKNILLNRVRPAILPIKLMALAQVLVSFKSYCWAMLFCTLRDAGTQVLYRINTFLSSIRASPFANSRMALRVFNTLSRTLQEFVPLDPEGKTVGMYCCGP